MSRDTIWTIGHSTRAREEFAQLLHSFQINFLADVRRFPGSRKYPWFGSAALTQFLDDELIQYRHFPDLGGRRKPLLNSPNQVWRNASFRGYADYMKTNSFRRAIDQLVAIASEQRVAVMCSEAVWWRCHRSLIADELKSRNWEVCHVMGLGKSVSHPYTSPARIIDGHLYYDFPQSND